MFGKKSDPVMTYKQVQNKYFEKEATKSCTDCGCIVLSSKLKEVKYLGGSGPKVFYCSRCKPHYDEVWYCADGKVKYFQRVPEHLVEVTEEGKKIVRKEGT